MCIECKDTGIVKTAAFDEQRVQVFCSCPIGRQKFAEYEAKLPRKYSTSYDENEIKKAEGNPSGPSRIITRGDSEIDRAFASII
jgi:hypothetical protein